MRKSSIVVLGSLIAVALATPAAMAQSKGGGSPRVSPPVTTPKGDQLHTQDRLKDQTHLYDQDRLQDRDQLKDQDKLHDQDKLQDRDRIHDQDGQPIYGYELMTPAERTAYLTKLRGMKTLQERNAYRAQHRIEMQQRARERGVSIPSGNGQGTQQQNRNQNQHEQQNRVEKQNEEHGTDNGG